MLDRLNLRSKVEQSTFHFVDFRCSQTGDRIEQRLEAASARRRLLLFYIAVNMLPSLNSGHWLTLHDARHHQISQEKEDSGASPKRPGLGSVDLSLS